MPSTPSLIVLDWGTTALRAYLLDDAGSVLDTRTAPHGIMHVPDSDFSAVFDAVTADWPPLMSIAAGMIGSASGWLEVPYCAAPAGIDELVASLTLVPNAELNIVPGVATYGALPNVMRGEETQIVGALALRPELAADSRLVLPGTHSKWVQVMNGKITGITTFMTGELYAVLCEHSILGRFASDPTADDDSFSRGVLVAKESAHGVSPLLFSARALVLTKRLAAGSSLEYLSGLLIGDEVRCSLADGIRPDALIGDATLCNRYRVALSLFDIHDVPVVDGAAHAGLFSIAMRAGLTRPVT
ncbi:MAG: 2-dehydro-3-deoxygalactonokinase [Gemmatimonadaceae bacterium]